MDVGELEDEAISSAQQRLRRVEGQVRGIQRMLDEGSDCEEVLRQIAAASKALRRVGVHFAVEGLQHCALDSEQHGADLDRFRRSFVELT